MFCLLLYIQRKRRIFGGRVRQHAEHQLAVIAEMRDQHLRVPQREPRRRIGGQQVVQRVQIPSVIRREREDLGKDRVGRFRIDELFTVYGVFLYRYVTSPFVSIYTSEKLL